MMKTELDLRPVFLVTDHGENQSAFWCGFCRAWHYHGRTETNETGIRRSHCKEPDSPLRESDYYITKDQNRVNAAMLRLWQEILDLRAMLKEKP